MRFGDNFTNSQHPPWATSYIDYIRLKQLIYPIFDLGYNAADENNNYTIISPPSDLSTPRHLPNIQTSEGFQKELNNEVQKALLFLLGTLGEVASELSELSEEFISLSANVQLQLNANELMQQIHVLRMKFIDRVGSKLLLLLEFIELNVEAITKIVKKHDKAVARLEASSGDRYGEEQHRYQRLRTQYLPRFAVHSTNANVRCLFLIAADAGDTNNNSKEKSTFGGWNAIQFNLEKTLKQLFRWERDLQARQNRVGVDSFVNLVSLQDDEPDDDFSPLSRHRSLSFGFDLASLSSPSKRKQSSEAPFFEPMLYRIQSTRKRISQSTNRYNRMVYAHEMLGEDNLDDNNQSQMETTRFGSIENMQKLRSQSIGGDPDVGPPSSIVSQLSKFLNLASSALYMCNYNVTTPTSGLYAKLLGFDEAHAGLIIGMTPAAVIVSSLLYSWWSSYSYKKALIFASSCCAIGNLIYAFALPCNSLTMVLVGRLMTGFGSARTINRRYIADYYNLEERTAGMADFVSASALGMAVGPGLAAFLSYVAPSGGRHASTLWTVETAPGYVMFLLWCVYLVANILFFEEPDRVTVAKEEKAATSDERAPLKPNTGINMDEEQFTKTAKRSFSFGGVPVVVSLLLLVLLKAVLEGLTSSTPTVSRYYFHWDVNTCGTYLAILASLMIPANYVVATVSRRFDDREIILAMLVMMAVGIAGFMTYAGSDGEASFICFSLIIFVSCNALEGPTMGLLSKVIPKSLRAGIFNAGWLATEAGTIGRVVGDFWLSGAAHKGNENLIDALFGPLITLVIGSTVVTLWNYSQLQPRYEDEEDDD